MPEIHISLASQLAEAERIARGTKHKLELVKAGGKTPSADQVLVLLKRQAIVTTLKKVIVNEAPLN